jgi:hypothetical protein
MCVNELKGRSFEGSELEGRQQQVDEKSGESIRELK